MKLLHRQISASVREKRNILNAGVVRCALSTCQSVCLLLLSSHHFFSVLL